MTWAFSRDDVEGAFFAPYIDMGIFGVSPFETIDADGVGRLVKIAAAEGRATRPGLQLGVCGEHGGDPASVWFFHEAGLDYVSCSPFRVPIARLEAGRAAVRAAAATPGEAPGGPPASGGPGEPGRAQRRARPPYAVEVQVDGLECRPVGTLGSDVQSGDTERWAAEPPKRAGPHRVPARPRAGPAQLRAAQARREDAGSQGRVRRLPAHPADPLARVRADRPGARRRARLRPRPGRRRLPGARPRPPAVRPQRRDGAGRPRGRRRRAGLRRLRGQRPVAAAADPPGAEGARRRPQPHPRHPGRRAQVPVAPEPVRAAATPENVTLHLPAKYGAYSPTLPPSSGSAPARPTAAAAWRRRSWTGPTTWPTPCTTWRTACTRASSP